MVLATGVQVWRSRSRSTQNLLRSTVLEGGRRNGDWEREELFAEIKEKLAPEEWAPLDMTMRSINLVPATFDRATATIACEDVKKVLVRHPELYERFDALYATPLAARIEASLNGTPRDHADTHEPSSHLAPPKQAESHTSLVRWPTRERARLGLTLAGATPCSTRGETFAPPHATFRDQRGAQLLPVVAVEAASEVRRSPDVSIRITEGRKPGCLTALRRASPFEREAMVAQRPALRLEGSASIGSVSKGI